MKLLGFVGFPEGHLFISEEVPLEYRKSMLIHELVEFTEFAGQKGRCVKALERELDFAPKGDGCMAYLKYRELFFERLI